MLERARTQLRERSPSLFRERDEGCRRCHHAAHRREGRESRGAVSVRAWSPTARWAIGDMKKLPPRSTVFRGCGSRLVVLRRLRLWQTAGQQRTFARGRRQVGRVQGLSALSLIQPVVCPPAFVCAALPTSLGQLSMAALSFFVFDTTRLSASTGCPPDQRASWIVTLLCR